MTRINTNVSSLLAQNNLAQANNQLQTSLTRLSTGLRINSGADDPAGLIAATNLGSDITSAQQAISNNQQATQMISTADSALGQVSSLLNTIRGLVTQAANTGTMSTAQIAANQSQVDSALSAINQIAQTTTFQGQTLLNGNLDFQTNFTAGGANVAAMQVNQVNMGAGTTMAVNTVVTGASDKAYLSAQIPSSGSATSANGTITFADLGTITIHAPTAGTGYNTSGNGPTVQFVQSSTTPTTAPTATYNQSANLLQITVNNSGTTTLAAVANAIQTQTNFTATTGGTANAILTPGLDTPTAQAASGTITTANNGIIKITSTATGATYNGNVVFTQGAANGASTPATWNASNNTLTVTVNNASNNGGVTSAATIAAEIGATAGGIFSATVLNAGSYNITTDNTTAAPAVSATLLKTLTNGALTFTDTTPGTSGNTYQVAITEDASKTHGQTAAAWGGAGNKVLTITVGTSGNAATLGDIYNAVNALGASPAGDTIRAAITTGTAASAYVPTTDEFNATTLGTGVGSVLGAAALQADGGAILTGGSAGVNAVLAAGTAGNGLSAATSFQVTGNLGTQVFNFASGTTLTSIVSAVAAASATTGVTATAGSASGNYTPIIFSSAGYGSDSFVQVTPVGAGAALGQGVTTGQLGTGTAASRATGTDVAGTINGAAAVGKDNTLSINSPSLNMSITVTNGYSGTVSFGIGGGGALFQVGPNVESSQQVQLGIQSVNVDNLGAASGRLYQIGSGQTAALATDAGTAENIVNEAQTQVTNLRARLGAFQSTTLDSNIATLTDTVQNLTAAQSSIQDADFAAESANLTRAQILVQSGTSVLSIANHNPENVLNLLK